MDLLVVILIVLFMQASNIDLVLLWPRYTPAPAVFNSDGYIPHARRDCPGNDFIAEFKVESFEECRNHCEVYAQCVGFVFRPYHNSGINCRPKDVCENLKYRSGGWATYKKIPGRGGCTFDRTPGFALYGHNDEVLVHTSVDSCQKTCLYNMKCLSFDYNSKKNICLMSHDSKELAPSVFMEHFAMDYYQKRCGTDEEAAPAELLLAPPGATTWMKDGHCIKSFGPYGPGGGAPFNDEAMMFTNITKVRVGHSGYINSVALEYGTMLKPHGGTAGTKVTTRLNPDEIITGIEGRFGGFLDKLLFVTNQRTIGPFGSDGGRQFSVDSHGKPLLYISGGAGEYVDNLSFHFVC